MRLNFVGVKNENKQYKSFDLIYDYFHHINNN